jgi:hypothetical protein
LVGVSRTVGCGPQVRLDQASGEYGSQQMTELEYADGE